MGFLDSLFNKKKSSSGSRPQRVSTGNPVLIRAMHQQAVNPGAENLMQVHAALLASTLFIPVPEIPDGLTPGSRTTEGPIQLQIVGNVDANNVRTTPAFTDVEALRNWDPNTPYLGIQAVDFFRFLLTTDVQDLVINPFDPIRKMIRPGGRVTHAEIAILANGVVPTLEKHFAKFNLRPQEKLSINRQESLPSSTIQQLLRARASSLPLIAELFYFRMSTEGGGSHPTIGIDLQGNAPRNFQDDIVRELSQAIRAELGPGESLDFIFVVGGPHALQIRRMGISIYRNS